MLILKWLAPILVLCGLATAPALAGPARAGEGVAFFENEVRPVLVKSCVRCHGPKKSEGGLRLDSRAAFFKGGESGPAVVAGKPDESRLIRAVRHKDELKMPPGKALPAREVDALVRWVQTGAVWPNEAATANALRSGPITDAERHFWSFQPIATPALPSVTNTSWPLTPLDRFILARLEKEGLRPAADADRRTWLRRVTFDLTGLPPTAEEIAAFLADQTPTAFERVVDRLLASPAYGERWGRHWLDVVRYADTAGDGADYPVREAYRYRDYVIASFNADKPYDTFVKEQLAGDILATAELGSISAERYAELITATGYLAVSKRYGYAPKTAFQHLDFADTIDNVGQTFLGLTLGCARCHDHKYDPLSSGDYYGLYGILASSEFTFPGGEEYRRPKGLVPLVLPAEAAASQRAFAAQLAEKTQQAQRLKDEKAKAEAEVKKEATEAAKATLAELAKKLAAAEAARAAFEATGPNYPAAYAVREGKAADTRIQKRGEPDRLGDVAPRRFLEILGGQPVPKSEKGSGRRQLADWIANRTNPLTARVMVNRVWQGHFGEGLVRSPNDFGTRGERPTHPELLDWLAARFMADGWSLKRLHRLIVLSRVYRQSGQSDPAGATRDPDNRLLGRYRRRMLDAEALRDAMLTLSGRLEPKPTGAHPFPPVDKWRFSIHYPFAAEYDSNSRSVYLMVQRLRRHSYLATFDGADPNLGTPQRRPTTTPFQALFLMNAPFVRTQAEGLAGRLLAHPGPEAERVRMGFEWTTGQLPTPTEGRAALEFLDRYRSQLAAAGISEDRRAKETWTALARVLLTGNGFLFVD
jgi:hypothetical protein